SVQNTYPPEENQRIVAEVIAQLKAKGAWMGEFSNVKKDGTAFTTRARITGLELSGRPYWVCVQEDVTQEKWLEEETRKRADFEQQLIGIVSHDLRNPISAIAMTATALLRRDDMDPRTTRSLLRIVNSSDRATRMIRDLLDFTQSRLGGGLPIQPVPTDLHRVIGQVVEEVQATDAERDIVVGQDGDGQGCWDEDRLAQVATNLLTNALNYSPRETPVRVTTREEGDAVVLEVHNRGEPIPPELLPTLFHPMHRGTAKVDKSKRSIGLGLYIVKEIATAHGGTVAVRSDAQEGTTFTVRLPRQAPLRRDGQG
ncbi:MAG TPA: HAMP domain-containing sensor histidine kinase, partial [Myxococcaceae bacterium]|nr:HAMP domain-containing sensor histidine kinase [Myxococcaceae bacterium]